MTPETTTATVATPTRVAVPTHREGTTSVPRAIRELGRYPAWLRAIDALHRGARAPITFGIDLIVLAAAGMAAGGRPTMAAGLALVMLFALYVGGAYGDRSSLETQGILWFVTGAAPPMAMTILGAVALAQVFDWSVTAILLAGAFGMGGLIAVRTLTCATLGVARRRGLGLERTLVVGHAKPACMLERKLAEYPTAGLIPVAMLPLGNSHGFARFRPEFPSASELTRAIQESGAKHVVLAPDSTDDAILECVKGAQGLEVTFSMLPPLSELFLHPGMVAQVGGLPLIPLGRIARGRSTLPGKRLFDLVVTSALLILLSPVFAATALAIRIFDGSPILYRQRRVGRNGKIFNMIKFRSMVPSTERVVIDLRERNASMAALFKVNDAPRITRVGRIIRRTAIDELPQLWNVIRGEMSLVGPRPIPVQPEDFNPIDNKRHTVPPGMTGYWQVRGDNGLTYEEMVKLDLAYVENWSLWLDVLLLFRTIPALLHRLGPS